MTPADFSHRMLLKTLCRVSKRRWRIAALGPNGTHGLSCSDELTNVPATPCRRITSRYGSGSSTILYAVEAGAVIRVVIISVIAGILSRHFLTLDKPPC